MTGPKPYRSPYYKKLKQASREANAASYEDFEHNKLVGHSGGMKTDSLRTAQDKAAAKVRELDNGIEAYHAKNRGNRS